MKTNKAGKICLFLLIAVTIGISPALAQEPEVNTLDLGLASDDEVTQALDKAADIELVNKEDNLTEADVSSETVSAAQETPAAGSGGGKADGKTDDNEYLEESRRLAKLAEAAFSEANYDASVKLADEAVDMAVQSDMYVATNSESGGPGTSGGSLPATYTVRSWSVSKDCFWNIAGFPWVYGNPYQWRTLYNANKSKLPDPNNPNVIEPGTVLDIPSIKGELRQGAWESGKTYEPLK